MFRYFLIEKAFPTQGLSWKLGTTFGYVSLLLSSPLSTRFFYSSCLSCGSLKFILGSFFAFFFFCSGTHRPSINKAGAHTDQCGLVSFVQLRSIFAVAFVDSFFCPWLHSVFVHVSLLEGRAQKQNKTTKQSKKQGKAQETRVYKKSSGVLLVRFFPSL